MAAVWDRTRPTRCDGKGKCEAGGDYVSREISSFYENHKNSCWNQEKDSNDHQRLHIFFIRASWCRQESKHYHLQSHQNMDDRHCQVFRHVVYSIRPWATQRILVKWVKFKLQLHTRWCRHVHKTVLSQLLDNVVDDDCFTKQPLQSASVHDITRGLFIKMQRSRLNRWPHSPLTPSICMLVYAVRNCSRLFINAGMASLWPVLRQKQLLYVGIQE